MKGGEGGQVREPGGIWCVLCSGAALESPVPPSHRTGQSSQAPPAQPVCCCCARCGAGRAQGGTAMLAPVTSGEQQPTEEPLAAGIGRATESASAGCGTREQPGCPVPACATTSVSPVVNMDWRHCWWFQRRWWPCAGGRVPVPSRGSGQGSGTARAAGEMPERAGSRSGCALAGQGRAGGCGGRCLSRAIGAAPGSASSPGGERAGGRWVQLVPCSPRAESAPLRGGLR